MYLYTNVARNLLFEIARFFYYCSADLSKLNWTVTLLIKLAYMDILGLPLRNDFFLNRKVQLDIRAVPPKILVLNAGAKTPFSKAFTLITVP